MNAVCAGAHKQTNRNKREPLSPFANIFLVVNHTPLLSPSLLGRRAALDLFWISSAGVEICVEAGNEKQTACSDGEVAARGRTLSLSI